jgi:two-component system sensor histidine kinase ChvG
VESFAADVAHELKNRWPRCAALDHGGSAAQLRRRLSAIAAHVLRIDRLVTEIADASRIVPS